MKMEQIEYSVSQNLGTKSKYSIEITQETFDNLPSSSYEVIIQGLDAGNNGDKIRLITNHLFEAKRATKYLNQKIMSGNIQELLLTASQGGLMDKINYELHGF